MCSGDSTTGSKFLGGTALCAVQLLPPQVTPTFQQLFEEVLISELFTLQGLIGIFHNTRPDV